MFLIALLTGQQSHYPFSSASPDWLQMPPLTSNTAFQPCCPGNQCWRGYWDGSQHALRACECIWAPSVTSCLGVKALLWGETHWHISSTGASHTSLLKKQPFQRSSVSTNVKPHEAHTLRKDQWEQSIEGSHPMGINECDLTQSSVALTPGFKALWQAGKRCLNLVLDIKSVECGIELRPQCKLSKNHTSVFTSSVYPADQDYPWLSHFRWCNPAQSIHGFGNVKLLGQFC